MMRHFLGFFWQHCFAWQPRNLAKIGRSATEEVKQKIRKAKGDRALFNA
jgi:hypothetical protein